VATADTFFRFVDVLAESLDDPTAYPERLHLSRFHVDRIVSAVAGEPPGALRRRILLERAAHRLLTTDDELLAVALDAGYSSHEAFTRAFQRAFGEVPSVWRHVATSFELDAPSGLHFNPPGGLRLPARRKVSAMEVLQRMVEHHVWLLGEMVDRAGSLPADVLDRRIEISVAGIDEEPTTRSLLSRLVGQLAMWNAAVDNQAYDFCVERNESLSSMRDRLNGAGPQFLAKIRGADFDETFVDAICDPPEVFTYGGMVAHVLTFAAHRRILVHGALEDAGVTDLNGDPMRWVADAA
jgi:AraC family transcriptional regulator